MRKICLFVFFLCAFVSQSLAQDISLKGQILDTSEKKPLPHAVIALLKKSDSTLATFTRSDKSGHFQLSNMKAGKYVVVISYPRFADYVDEIELKNPEHNLNTVPLTPTSLLLKEVVIRSGQAIHIKGDTTEFTADSFVVKDGATVEDLLKKLPGFQVNAKGEITAQGKRVEKVLVDGEEFFGDDPTMATQNLSAKIVDKVQVYDSKTEQQQLTGITSGSEGKTINIKLKEDKKKGAFGKLYAGTDFGDYIDAKGLYNKFVGKKKISVYGTKSTISTGSLNWEDRQKLGMEDDMEYDEIGGFYYSYGSDDGFNDWSLRGLPDSYTAGGLFSNKWNEDKQNINLSYRFNRLGTENVGTTNTQYIRANTIDYRNVATNTDALNQQHQANAKYEWKADSLTSFKLTVNGLRKTTDQYSSTFTEFLDIDKELQNKSSQARENHTERLQSDNVFTYKQLFKKKNRQMITTLRFGVTEDDQEGRINSQLQFFANGDSSSVVDQMKAFDGHSQTIGGKITFSEPLTPKMNLVLDYGHNRNNSSSYRNTYNKGTNGKYEVLDSVFSNNFDFDAYSHSSTAILRYVDKKVRFAFGSGLSAVNLVLKDLDGGKKTNYDFLRVTPQGQFSYTFKPQMVITLNYRGTTRQPGINQLQPLRDNSDPLYEYKGNPDLKVGFNHNFSSFFNQYKVLSRRGLWVNFSYNMTNNAVVNATTFDPVTRRQTTMPVNVDGVRNWYFNGNWNKGGGEKEKRLAYGFRINGNGGRSFNFVDGRKNTSNYSTYKVGLSLGFDNPEKSSFDVRPEVGYNRSTSSLNTSIKNNYFTYGGWVNGFVMLPGKVELRSEMNFDLREHINAFSTNTNIVQWNASIAKKVFKDKSGKLFLMANDLLNQNKGFTRNINSSFITEDRYSRVSQYFLLKFEWSFNKMPGSK